jgi:hypothetical protein
MPKNTVSEALRPAGPDATGVSLDISGEEKVVLGTGAILMDWPVIPIQSR